MDAGNDGLSLGELVLESGHTDALETLRRLRKATPEWGSVLLPAGKRGGRYRLIS